MSEISSSALSEIICTRISHDLIGNIGAVSNAVELLEDGDMDFLDDIKSILNVSSRVLSARMKFFRMAFGLDSSNLENAEMIVKTCEEYVQTIGNQKNYPISLQLKLSNAEKYGRLLMLAVMVMADVVVKGGLIEAEDDAEKMVMAVSSAAPLSIDKISAVKDIHNGILPGNKAQFAAMIYLQYLAEKESRPFKLSEYNGLEMVIG